MEAVRTSLPPAPAPSTLIAWTILPSFFATIVTLPLFTLGSAGVSLYSVSLTATELPPAAGVAVVAGGAAAAELVDFFEGLLLLPPPAATRPMTGASATTKLSIHYLLGRERSFCTEAPRGRFLPGPAYRRPGAGAI